MSEEYIGTVGTIRIMVRAMCGVPFKDWKRVKDLIKMLSMNDVIDHLAIANSEHWYELRREKNNVLRSLWLKGTETKCLEKVVCA